MRLFFETGGQCACFLTAVPIGFVLACCLDSMKGGSLLRLMLDVAFFLLAGLAVLLLMIFLSEEKVRLYHLLGMLTGALLYVRGIRVVTRKALLFHKHRRKKSAKEGFSSSQSEEVKIE